ncbi:hypothetical protein PCE1_000709 [Barthelona sp. PCE]
MQTKLNFSSRKHNDPLTKSKGLKRKKGKFGISSTTLAGFSLNPQTVNDVFGPGAKTANIQTTVEDAKLMQRRDEEFLMDFLFENSEFKESRLLFCSEKFDHFIQSVKGLSASSFVDVLTLMHVLQSDNRSERFLEWIFDCLNRHKQEIMDVLIKRYTSVIEAKLVFSMLSNDLLTASSIALKLKKGRLASLLTTCRNVFLRDTLNSYVEKRKPPVGEELVMVDVLSMLCGDPSVFQDESKSTLHWLLTLSALTFYLPTHAPIKDFVNAHAELENNHMNELCMYVLYRSVGSATDVGVFSDLQRMIVSINTADFQREMAKVVPYFLQQEQIKCALYAALLGDDHYNLLSLVLKGISMSSIINGDDAMSLHKQRALELLADPYSKIFADVCIPDYLLFGSIALHFTEACSFTDAFLYARLSGNIQLCEWTFLLALPDWSVNTMHNACDYLLSKESMLCNPSTIRVIKKLLHVVQYPLTALDHSDLRRCISHFTGVYEQLSVVGNEIFEYRRPIGEDTVLGLSINSLSEEKRVKNVLYFFIEVVSRNMSLQFGQNTYITKHAPLSLYRLADTVLHRAVPQLCE